MITLNVTVIRGAAQAVGGVVMVKISDSLRDQKIIVGKSKDGTDTGVLFPRLVCWHS
jgi:hypothetical protein